MPQYERIMLVISVYKLRIPGTNRQAKSTPCDLGVLSHNPAVNFEAHQKYQQTFFNHLRDGQSFISLADESG